MKIGLLNFHWAYNYGAVLQSYALQKYLESIGNTVEYINYLPDKHSSSFFRPSGILSGNCLNTYLLKFNFEMFRKKFLSTSKKISRSKIDYLKDRYDCLIVGSDQVWNGNGNDSDPTYFFDFGINWDVIKASYAACFGEINQPTENIQNIHNYLNKFDFISVRNSFSKNILIDQGIDNVEITVDSTFLDDFSAISSLNIGEDGYILIYSLGGKFRKLGQIIAERARKLLDLPVFVLYPDFNFHPCDFNRFTACPKEWIDLIKRANLIITNSFHGTVFSVKFNKKFISWTGSRSNRLFDLLSQYKLEDRIVRLNGDMENIDKLIFEKPDYESYNKNSEFYIQDSKRFIERIIGTE